MQRSDALNEWIAKHSTSEGLIEDLPNLSPSLKKELLREALELNIETMRIAMVQSRPFVTR